MAGCRELVSFINLCGFVTARKGMVELDRIGDCNRNVKKLVQNCDWETASVV
jgi:hypothetical protein